MKKSEYKVIWPENIDPCTYPVRSYNQLFILASAKDIWHVLINATLWPKWYQNAKMVKIEGGGTLNLHTKFSWKTFGLYVKSEVQIFHPFTDLGWDAR